MQKLLLRLTAIALILTSIFTTGCEEDPIIDPLGPVISLLDDAGFVFADAEVDAGAYFMVKIKALPGDAQLQSVSILENGSTLDFNQIIINSGAISSNNPFLITGADKDGATYEIAILADAGFNILSTYTFKVGDEGNLTDEVSIDITTKGEPVTTKTGVLLNQGGPAGTGGLDLDEGEGTGTTASDTAAEIRDEGIDIALPNDQNWRQQISGMNGSVIRTPGAGLPESFNFDDIAYGGEISSAFDQSDDLTENSADGNRLVTPVVAVGDVFLVKNGDKYYIIKIDEVNVTASDNTDNYVISIKY